MAAGRNAEQEMRIVTVRTESEDNASQNCTKSEDGSKQKLRTGSANSSRMNHASSEDGGRHK